MKKELAIISVSKQGLEKANSLHVKNADIYALPKYSDGKCIEMIEGFTLTVERIFSQYKTLLFIMASGIVVRTIAPLLKGKDIDPAILVMDEQGIFVNSLLSGHLGGANEMAEIIAKACDAIPVISTASDVSHKIAVDTIAMKLNAKIDSLKKAKNVTALILNGQRVALCLPENIVVENKNISGVIVVSNKLHVEMSQIIPQNIIVGIGCKKDIPKEAIIEAVKKEFKKLNLREDSIKHFATGWVKAEEKGLLEAVNYFERELKIIEKEEIRAVQDKFCGSDFVEKTIGVRSISAPSAYVSSSKKGVFLLEKNKNCGITISIYEEEVGNEK
ncbi:MULTISPECIES: cobalt-precorrin 5A hydrolase [Sulfurospirillum]|uniref:Cobalamin biosynthesis protein CbiG n=4 Tax=Sulfurospirillum TaxID=57665 RepID=A0A1Y0HL03_9BACT|nr:MULTISPECIES: cobalt-precorrin 5A hydrolase [Sulfurospirillum]AHJ12821.1 cobalamin biosynthesis protein CbiG [Sulfurospirillum multivorans DSM 12446]AOO65300.1 cobalamin biosynthesis protein CbiG [Sulfurospirillum halorespirans DSM 13726]ARU48781.1 cobalamin biosynthesis protein CbiG [Sulfurospirillum diekertiae]ASC93603.1 cobalamin biosynthesis protein CbiG [Sulfurospirillum diekertiae]ATB69647.1 cobalamin biosynthesis protein CbiG [Sulfurospirillum diekertiae]